MTCCYCGERFEDGENAHAVTGPSTDGTTRMWHADREECSEAHADWLRMREEVRYVDRDSDAWIGATMANKRLPRQRGQKGT